MSTRPSPGAASTPALLAKVRADMQKGVRSLSALEQAFTSEDGDEVGGDAEATLALESIRRIAVIVDTARADLATLSARAATHGVPVRQIGLAQNISPNTAAARIRSVQQAEGAHPDVR